MHPFPTNLTPEHPAVSDAVPALSASRPFAGAAAALAITIPHALGVGLIAFAPLGNLVSAGALALWSAAVPGALMTLLARSRGVVYAPATPVAMLFGGMLALIMQAGAELGVTAAQALAITGAFVALGFFFQWIIGQSGLAGLARFLPVSVTNGFSAGVGLSLILTQLLGAFGAGSWVAGPVLLWHMAVAASVAFLSLLLQALWPRVPALLTALILVTLGALWLAPADTLRFAAQPGGMFLPLLPDWQNAPWLAVIGQVGIPLATLSLLMGVVNGLDVLMFHHQLVTEHGAHGKPDVALRRESMWGVLCALFGMVPTSTSPSRSRVALSFTRIPTLRAGQWHALAMLAVALTSHLWLHWTPLAGLAGALLIAGTYMVPSDMWRAPASMLRREAWWQSWLVAGTFAASGGAMALLAGLTVSTVVLLRATATHAIRRMHLQGKLRSRHVRRAEVDAWLSEHMAKVAVFEIQGILSFGVAAMVVDQVRKHLNGHRWVILDTSRAPSWDETGHIRLHALANDLQAQGIGLLISGVSARHREALDDLHCFDDLERALEWAEEQFLLECPAHLRDLNPALSQLGDLAGDIPEPARHALEQRMRRTHYPARAVIIRSGDLDRTLMLVNQGTVTLSTSVEADKGLRLAVIGPGMVFGEMAFLNGIARTAFAHAGPSGALVSAIAWSEYEDWAGEYPDAALGVMRELARMGIRRLGATSQELRAAME